jgi:hypothetical protein
VLQREHPDLQLSHPVDQRQQVGEGLAFQKLDVRRVRDALPNVGSTATQRPSTKLSAQLWKRKPWSCSEYANPFTTRVGMPIARAIAV